MPAQNAAQWTLQFVGLLCFFILSTHRMNMTIGMLCMVDWSEVKTANFCNTPSNNHGKSLNDSVGIPDKVPIGEFPWSITLQNLIHSSYFFGLTMSYLPAEKLLVKNFSTKYPVLIGMLLSSICNLLIPTVARLHVGGLIAARIIQAISHVIISLSFSIILGKWIPTKHLISSMVFATSGVPFGAFFVVILTGATCHLYSWTFVFYLTGYFGIVWCLIWLYFCFDAQFIPVLIGCYTNPNPDYPKPKLPVPYSGILTSLPFWGYVAAGIASYWIFAMNMCVVPIYFRNVFDTSIEWNGQLSSFPNVLQASLYIFSFTLLTKKIGRKTGRRRVCACLGIFGFAACMVLLSFVHCMRPLGALLMIIGIGLFGCTQAAMSLIAVDMSPNFSGILSSIMNTTGAAAGSLLPILVALLTGGEEGNIRDWEKVFYLSFFVTFISMILFMAFSSCDIQPWNEPSPASNTDSALQGKRSGPLDTNLPFRKETAEGGSSPSGSKSKRSKEKKK